MNRHLIFASLLLICAPHITFTMENSDEYEEVELTPISQQQKQIITTTATQTISQKPSPSNNEIADRIVKAVNKKYNNFFGVPRRNLSAEEFFDILDTINQHSNAPSIKLLNALEKKSDYYFSWIITNLKERARRNIDNVTLDTFETVQRPAEQQSGGDGKYLNKLPVNIKVLIMNDAYDKIPTSYDIILTHSDTIISFDIHAPTHCAATSSLDKTFCLWDLTTGKLIHTFPKNTITARMSFNPDGSRLATATNYTDGTSILDIWETQSAQPLHSTKIDFHISKLCHGTNNTVIIFDNANFPGITVLSINQNILDIQSTAHLLHMLSTKNTNAMIWEDIYTAKQPHQLLNKPEPTLTITKNIDRSFYLYKQIVKNTKDIALNDVKQLPLFQKFTELEQSMITAPLFSKQPEGNKLLTNK